MREALAVIAERGLAELSIREVARRLDVSHQAPYKLFPSRDHLIAATAARAFEHFAAFLDDRRVMAEPRDDLRALGERYLAFADAFPLEYQLMFGITLPDARAHPEMTARARHAFDSLRTCLAGDAEARGSSPSHDEIDLEAMFVWSSVHGLATLRRTRAAETLGLSSVVHDRVDERVFDRIESALEATLPERRHRHVT